MKLTVNDRVLLFLYEHRSAQDDYEVPNALTQAGISEGIGISVTHVPRAVGKLEADSLVHTRTSYVKGASRKKKTYHLTRDGLMNAREFLTGLEGKKIKFISGEEEGEMVLSDIVEKLKKDDTYPKPPTSFEIIQALDDDGILDMDSLKKDICSISEEDRVDDSVKLIGREDLLKQIGEELASNQIIILQGPQGIGKSSSIKAAVQSFKERTSSHLTLSHLTDADKEQLHRCLGSSRSTSKEFGPLIDLDLNLHTGTDLDPVAQIILEILSHNNTKVILTSVDPLSNFKRLLEGKKIKVLELKPLSNEDMIILAKENTNNLPDKEIDSLIFMAKGNPGKLLGAIEIDINEDTSDLDDHEKALMRMLRSDD